MTCGGYNLPVYQDLAMMDPLAGIGYGGEEANPAKENIYAALQQPEKVVTQHPTGRKPPLYQPVHLSIGQVAIHDAELVPLHQLEEKGRGPSLLLLGESLL